MIRLPMLPQLPIKEDWTCCRSGECCTKPGEVVMTHQEAAALVHAAPREIALHFRPLEQPGFVAMKAGPCPLYAFGGCLAYAARPYNCRRYVCLRADVQTEAFDSTGQTVRVRVRRSRAMRRIAERTQRKAQRWALNHGWRV